MHLYILSHQLMTFHIVSLQYAVGPLWGVQSGKAVELMLFF